MGKRGPAAAALLLLLPTATPARQQVTRHPAARHPASSQAPRAAATGPAERATRAALARIAARDGTLHAVIAVNPQAIAAARALDRRPAPLGALSGRPVLIKDNIETRDQPTTAGSLALAANATGRDATVVARLRDAGAVILGKTNLSEWANIRSNHSISGWSAIGGQTRNPADPTRSPCGSSSGSAAAVAAGYVDLAIGTETDGSITCPAAMTGIVGLKPTVGLVSRHFIVPISHSQDSAGPMARTVRDAALLLAAIAGSDPDDPPTAAADQHRADYVAALDQASLRGVRLGVMRFDTGRSPKADAAFEAGLAVLARAGAVLVDIPASGIALGQDEELILHTELKADLAFYLASTPPTVTTRTLADVIAFNRAHAARELGLFGQETFVAAEASRSLDDPAYRAARKRAARRAGPDGIDRLLREHRVVALVGPTATPAIPIDPVNGDTFPAGPDAGSIAAVAGYPHLTVPMARVQGLPVGLSFIGPAWSEAQLLALGQAFESARGPIG